MESTTPMSDEDMRKELQNIQLKMNATTDEVKRWSFLCAFQEEWLVGSKTLKLAYNKLQ